MPSKTWPGWQRIWSSSGSIAMQAGDPKVLPPRSTDGRKGVLATRSPHRPNPLGLSVLRLERVEGPQAACAGCGPARWHAGASTSSPMWPTPMRFRIRAASWLTPGAADPGKACAVIFTAQADAQLEWIAARSPLPVAPAHREYADAGAAAASVSPHQAGQGWWHDARGGRTGASISRWMGAGSDGAGIALRLSQVTARFRTA